MSNKKSEETAAPELASVEETEKLPAKQPKFTIERLRKECIHIFGVTASTFDGATFGMKGAYTVEEIRRRLGNWKSDAVVQTKKEVK